VQSYSSQGLALRTGPLMVQHIVMLPVEIFEFGKYLLTSSLAKPK